MSNSRWIPWAILTIISWTFSPIALAANVKCVQDQELCFYPTISGEYLDLKITFRSPGWIGFGISPSQTMFDADLWVPTQNTREYSLFKASQIILIAGYLKLEIV
jgi:hypothetical protein